MKSLLFVISWHATCGYKNLSTFFFPFIILMWKSCSSIQTRISGNTEPRIGGRIDLPLNLAAVSEFFAPVVLDKH